MAEALGLAASIIAVVDMTGKAVKLSVKLKYLWNEVKDVPTTLLEKAEELQDIEEFLREAECQSTLQPVPHSVWNDKFMQKAITKARVAMSDLQATIEDLNAQVTDKRRYKRKFATARVLIHKDSLEAMERKLDRALNLFKMAQGLYCATMTNLCTSVIVQRLPEPVNTSNGASANSGRAIEVQDANHLETYKSGLEKATVPDATTITQGRTLIGRLHYGFGNQSGHISMRTPDWLCRTVYSLMAKRSTSGWQFNLSTFSVIDLFDEEVIVALEKDDVALMKKCLYDNNLTPFTHNSIGLNLLQLAADHVSVKIAKWLLEIGLQPGSFSEYPFPWDNPIILPVVARTPLEIFLFFTVPNDASPWVETLKLFDTYAPDILSVESNLWHSILSIASFHRIRNIGQILSIDYLSVAYPIRIRHAGISISRALWSWEEALWLIPELRAPTKELLEVTRCNCNWGVADLVASGVGLQFASPKSKQGEPETDRGFKQALGEITRLDPEEISPPWDKLSVSQWTPICHMISRMLGNFDKCPPDVVEQAFQSAIWTWATTLYENGMDLLEYGRREKERYQNGGFFSRWGTNPSWLWERDLIYRKRSRVFLIAILGITYGPLPEQWRLWWTPADLGFAEEFWNMVEDPIINIPGSWNDDFCDTAEDYGLYTPGFDWDENIVLPRMIWSEYRKIKPPV
ncbi:uncharacterized protein CTRU02_209590 [Colletotrichum truncatum]|uniref:Uncharacterized protein n=1 Tax=Colletotrichum truncatum TaxID=5467 RepID=A0ACC3YSS8_COLTU